MNENHLHQIFKNYIEKFEEVNNTEHREYYKWQIAKIFRPMMDDALKSEDAEFMQTNGAKWKRSERCFKNCLVMTAEICKSGKRKSKHFWNKAIS